MQKDFDSEGVVRTGHVLNDIYGVEGAGACFLDPYGEAQRPRWAEYKQALGSLNLTEAESDALLAAAQDMFRAIGRISEELDAARRQ